MVISEEVKLQVFAACLLLHKVENSWWKWLPARSSSRFPFSRDICVSFDVKQASAGFDCVSRISGDFRESGTRII